MAREQTHVLVVEDDRLVARMLDKYLRAEGWDVAVTYGGSDAWSHLSSTDPPLVALIDWSIPDLSGPELCSRVRARSEAPFTYLVLVTGRFARQDLEAGLDMGADEYIAKPFLVEHVIERVAHGVTVARERRRTLTETK